MFPSSPSTLVLLRIFLAKPRFSCLYHYRLKLVYLSRSITSSLSILLLVSVIVLIRMYPFLFLMTPVGSWDLHFHYFCSWFFLLNCWFPSTSSAFSASSLPFPFLCLSALPTGSAASQWSSFVLSSLLPGSLFFVDHCFWLSTAIALVSLRFLVSGPLHRLSVYLIDLVVFHYHLLILISLLLPLLSGLLVIFGLFCIHLSNIWCFASSFPDLPL